MTLGALLIGFLAWPLANPADPYGAVLFGKLGVFGALTLLVLSTALGAVGSLIARPYGEKIGILAVPAGLGIWAIRGGDMAAEILKHNSAQQQKQLYTAMTFETFFWIIIIAAGFAGAFLAKKFLPTGQTETNPEKKPNKPKLNFYLNSAAAIAISGVIAQFLIGILAKDVNYFDTKAGLVITGQPASAQIIFALLVSFGAAAYVTKKYLNSCYIWTILAAGLVSSLSFITYTRSDILPYLAENWSFVFFANPVLSILPLQIAVFGTLGAIWGYWLAVRYDFWKKHQLG